MFEKEDFKMKKWGPWKKYVVVEASNNEEIWVRIGRYPMDSLLHLRCSYQNFRIRLVRVRRRMK